MSTSDKQAASSVHGEEWKTTLDHLREGYKNGQEAIRSVDTKVSVLTGLATFALAATAGAVGAVCDWLKSDPSRFRHSVDNINPISAVLLLFALAIALSFLLGVRSIWSSMRALTPRPRESFTSLPATALFPFLPYGRRQDEKRQEALQHYQDILGRDLDPAAIRREYQDQIQNIGNILGQKIAHCGSAIRWFRAQIIAAGFAAIMVVIFIAACLLDSTQGKASSLKESTALRSSITLHEPGESSIQRDQQSRQSFVRPAK